MHAFRDIEHIRQATLTTDSENYTGHCKQSTEVGSIGLTRKLKTTLCVYNKIVVLLSTEDNAYYHMGTYSNLMCICMVSVLSQTH